MNAFPLLAVTHGGHVQNPMRCEAYQRALWPASKPESRGTQSATSPVRPLTCLLRAAFLSERQPAPTNTSASCRPSRQVVWTTATAFASPTIGCVSSMVITCNGWRACRNAYDSRTATVHRPCHHAHPSGIPADGAERRYGLAPGRRDRRQARPVIFAA
ncbi:hypothetical protein LZ32DRAFT_308062 [Colletotrichum eremochloae]|nr:hypothetical protein LZ32DRAFT_308062 [Colletotrichum eremochloae]